MNTNTATEYRNLPLAVLTESATNPRRIFEDSALKELAESIRSQGVLSPLLFAVTAEVTGSSPVVTAKHSNLLEVWAPRCLCAWN